MLLNLRLGAYFCAPGYWEPDVRFSKEPDLIKIEEPDFNVKICKRKPIFVRLNMGTRF